MRASEAHGDFIIEPSRKVPGLLHIAAIDSPGLTSSAAIAEYAVSLLAGMGVKLERNPDFNPYRENMHAFREMNDEEKNAFIQTHPDFGRMVCRCESVSEGEIRAAIRKIRVLSMWTASNVAPVRVWGAVRAAFVCRAF